MARSPRKIGIQRTRLPDQGSTITGRIGVVNSALELNETIQSMYFKNMAKKREDEAELEVQKLTFSLDENGMVKPPELPPKPTNGFRTPSIFNETYTENALAAYGQRVLLESDNHLQELARNNKLDPAAFDEAAAAYNEEVVASTLPEIRGDVTTRLFAAQSQYSNRLHDEQKARDDVEQAELFMQFHQDSVARVMGTYAASAPGQTADIIKADVEELFAGIDQYDGQFYNTAAATTMKQEVVEQITATTLIRDTRAIRFDAGMSSEDLLAASAERNRQIEDLRAGKGTAYKLVDNEIRQISASQLSQEERNEIAGYAAQHLDLDMRAVTLEKNAYVAYEMDLVHDLVADTSVDYAEGNTVNIGRGQKLMQGLSTDEARDALAKALPSVVAMAGSQMEARDGISQIEIRLASTNHPAYDSVRTYLNEMHSSGLPPQIFIGLLENAMKRAEAGINSVKLGQGPIDLITANAQQGAKIEGLTNATYEAILANNPGMDPTKARQLALDRSNEMVAKDQIEITPAMLGHADEVIEHRNGGVLDYDAMGISDIQTAIDSSGTVDVLPQKFITWIMNAAASPDHQRREKGAMLWEWASSDPRRPGRRKSLIEGMGTKMYSFLKHQYRPGVDSSTSNFQTTLNDIRSGKQGRILISDVTPQRRQELYKEVENHIDDVIEDEPVLTSRLAKRRMQEIMLEELPPGIAYGGTLRTELARQKGIKLESFLRGTPPSTILSREYKNWLIDHVAVRAVQNPNYLDDGEITEDLVRKALGAFWKAGYALSTTTVDFGQPASFGTAWMSRDAMESYVDPNSLDADQFFLDIEKAAQKELSKFAGMEGVPEDVSKTWRMGKEYFFVPGFKPEGGVPTFEIAGVVDHETGDLRIIRDQATLETAKIPPELFNNMVERAKEQDIARRQLEEESARARWNVLTSSLKEGFTKAFGRP